MVQALLQGVNSFSTAAYMGKLCELTSNDRAVAVAQMEFGEHLSLRRLKDDARKATPRLG